MPYKIGSYVIDPEAYELRARGVPMPAEPQVLDLLILLIENRARVVGKDEIIARVWNGRAVSDASLSTRIKTARRALGDTGEAQDVIRTIYGRGFRFVGEVTVETGVALSAEPKPSQNTRKIEETLATDRPSVAVLPFHQRQFENGVEQIAESLSEEITTGLSCVRSFFVIANASSRNYSDSNVDVRKVARILGVRYLVQGTVRIVGASVLASVRLVDGPTRRIAWAQRFSVQRGTNVDMHEKIIEAIIGALAPNILVAEIDRVRRKPPDTFEAYDYVLRAMPQCWALDKANCVEAIALLEAALALEPDYGLALALLSWCHAQHCVYNWSNDPEQKEQALLLARRAAAIDGRNPLVLILLGTAECLAHNINAAALHVSQGLALDPNSAWGWNRSGYIHTYRGQSETAIEHFNRSRRLSPLDPISHSTFFGMAGAHFVAGRYGEALTWIDQAILCGPEMIWMHRLGAACAAMAGNRVRAARSVEHVQSFAPGIDATQLTDAVPWQVPEIRERYRAALLQAGFAK